ncbi:hypothetical protein HYW41_00970 [Candidatus Daviesbacteria bacterium]|nr:hypothetical protein [Candidatus Daviesbacteria bacterium]
MSLNDATGDWEWHKVEKTMNMGIQEVFKIYTRSGLSIETTENHPYLVRMKAGKPETLPLGGTFEVDQSPKIEQMTKDSFIAIASTAYPDQAYVLKIRKGVKRQLLNQFKSKKTKNFAPMLFGRSIALLIKLARISPDRLIIDKDFPGYNSLVEEMIIQSLPKVSIEFKSVGKNSPAHIAAFSFVSKKEEHKKTTVIPFEGTIAALHPEFHRDWPVVEADFGVSPKGSSLPAHGLFSSLYHKRQGLSRKDTAWTKVAQLKPGMIIATLRGWEPIRTIHSTNRKLTYDLQIANTHNFVGNNIVAHNTYLNGNLGLGIQAPSSKLQILGDGTGTGVQLLTQNNTQTNFGLSVLDNGNVGIGTTAPSVQFQVGSTNYGGNTDIYVRDGSSSDLRVRYDDTYINSINERSMNVANNDFILSTSGGVSNREMIFKPRSTEAMRISGVGNVGIGFTSPAAKLDVMGTALLRGSSTTTGLAVTAAGNVGVGTTSPLANLHVVGQCVTGDTLLKRRRRKRRTMDDGEIEDGDLKMEPSSTIYRQF